MAYDPHQYPQQIILPMPDCIRIDEITERHEAARQFKDLKVLLTNIAAWPMPPRPMKVVTDTSTMNRRDYVAENAVEWSRALARLETRPTDTRRMNE